MRVASYNIRKCVGLDRRRRPERIAEVIAGLNADIVALQEADRRLGARPAALTRAHVALTGLNPVPIATNGVSLGWHGNALLIRPEITVRDIHRITLPGLEPRGAVIVDLSGNGAVTRVVATHLGLTRRHRRQQLDRIAQHLQDLPPSPTIIMGDFNEWSGARGLEPLHTDFTVHAPGRSFHAARPVASLDRIAHCPHFTLTDAGVSETPLSARASDHLPVWADLATGA